MRKPFTYLIAFTSGSVFAFAPGTQAEELTLVVETRILDQGIAASQAGMKSRQTFIINTAEETVTERPFETGVTDFGPFSSGSIRDDFKYKVLQLHTGGFRIQVSGETASPVVIMPNINYRFEIQVNVENRRAWIEGCHDGFPSYEVTIDGRRIYWHEQSANPGELIGDCDTQASVIAKRF